MFTTEKTLNKRQLKQSPTTHPPWERISWGAVPYYELFKFVDKQLNQRGWVLRNGRFYVGQHGYRAGAKWFVTPPNDPELPNGLDWCVSGVTGGPHIRRFQLYLGAYDPKLDFFCVFGNTCASMPRKGQGPETLSKAIRHLAAHIKGIDEKVVGYTTTPVRDVRGATCLLQAARNGHLPWSRLLIADTMWRDTDATPQTIWGLLRCHAEASKRSPVLRQMEELNAFRLLAHNTLGGHHVN